MNFTARGRVEALDSTSREFYDQVIAFVIQTENGELPLDPSFGATSPLFTNDQQTGLIATLLTYWPQIRIAEINIDDADGVGERRMKVVYEV